MRADRQGLWAGLVAVVLVTLGAAPARGQRVDTAYARVTYVSGASVYVDAGERDGLREGDVLDVLRRAKTIARAHVRFLSPTRAECGLDSVTETPVAGDSVRYLRRAVAVIAPDSALAPLRPTAGRRAAPRAQPLHGRVGVRYSGSWQRDSGSAHWSQPASDVRLDGTVPGVPALDVSVDARGRRTIVVSTGGVRLPSTTSTFVYEAAVRTRLPLGTRLAIGRQQSAALADVSLFDGALLEVVGQRADAGAFYGTQPDVETMGLSGRVREYGAFVTIRAAPEAATSWTVSTGAIGSYDRGHLDREFAFASVALLTNAVSLFASQELDYNRGWKQDFAPRVAATGTQAWIQARVAEPLTVQAGYDNRRAVRLYRNYLTPEIAFDDAFRMGAWGGVRARLGSRASIGLDGRHRSGGSDGAASVFSVTAAARDLWVAAAGVRARSSRFLTPAATGWLHSAALEGTWRDAVRIELSGGARSDRPRAGTSAAAVSDRVSIGWAEVSSDVSLGRAWYLLTSLTREDGGWEASDHLYVGLTYRF